MTRLNTFQKTSLAERFGDRVSFQKTERRLYGHDIAAMPGLVKPIIGSTVPEAVVQPETEEELVNLVNWARREHVALTPRGMATSGYGGVLPVKQGVVVDFHRMNRILIRRYRESDGHRRAGRYLGTAGQRPAKAGSDPAAVPHQLPRLNRRGLAGAGWGGHRFVRNGLVPRQCDQRSGGSTRRYRPGIRRRRP